MGKNMMATICEEKDCEELCYYGARVCNQCDENFIKNWRDIASKQYEKIMEGE